MYEMISLHQIDLNITFTFVHSSDMYLLGSLVAANSVPTI